MANKATNISEQTNFVFTLSPERFVMIERRRASDDAVCRLEGRRAGAARSNNRWCVGSRRIIGMSEANRGVARAERQRRARDYDIDVNDLRSRRREHINR